ncbi:chromosomal replication initiator protein DnaA [Spiroplasma endosymbiont of Megaselia nigra]|uniref:chromosomal replication initiator protein DnaA n=1 Tax=Spiroplasma endosymbiont of Megaselia nigra TaxID=2478537 RepID=UPI000F886CD2|nr:chromosomal replication initiator protein DnaA [Spiroplasma endosymbiont of Megaselia nigra]RUO86902.1 chromosomal replication initiator protein DnaA [Spiroplasma endosymbiont of Megaselia nigra]
MNTKELWIEVKEILSRDESVSPEIYNYYISDTNLYTVSDNNCLITTKSEIAIGVFEAGLNEKIKNILKKLTGIQYNISFELEKNINKQASVISKIDTLTENNNIAYYENYTFENFVRGDSNHEAMQAALAVALDLGKKWNPLFIYGDSGLGKTHLLHAIENKVNEIYKTNNRVKYLKAYEFGKIAMDILNQGHEIIEAFKTSYDIYDCLLIDDIQLLAKRNKTNELFFHIFNSYIEKNKQIVITSDKYPDDLGGFESRIISRFSYGLSIGLDSPDFETALKILEQKLKHQNNLELFSEESLEFIALNFNSDVRKLEGAIKRLLFLAVMNKKPNEIITLADVEKAFKNAPLQNNEKITTKKIKQIVADNYNITIKAMMSKSRISNVMQARQLAMYFCRTLLDEPFTRIGTEFGGKDHTTVMNSVKKVEAHISTNKEFKHLVNAIRRKIEGK